MSKEEQPLPAILTEKIKPPYAHEKTREFLKAIIAEGGHIIPEELRNTAEGKMRAFEQIMIGTYYSTQLTLEDIASLYGVYTKRGSLTRQGTQEAIKRGMRRLWENSSEDTKRAFPWDKRELPLAKPPSLRSRINYSIALGGKSVNVANAIQEGKSAREIRQSGVTRDQLRSARLTLKAWGVEKLPYEELAGEAKSSLTKHILAAETPEELREYYLQVNIAYYWSETRGENPTLIKFEDLLTHAGFSARNIRNRHTFIEALEHAGIVVGVVERQPVRSGIYAGKVQRYYFIRSKDVENATRALLENPNLARFRAR